MPSKPASNNNQTTSSTTTQSLPDWLANDASNVANNGMILGSTPGGVQPLPQYTAAPLTDAANADIQGLQNGVGSTAAGYGSAQGATSNFLGYTPQQVSAGSLANTDLSPYLNPYTQTVINSALPLLDQQRQQANNQTAAQAVSAGAFGGSREGVAEGVNNSQSALNAAQLAAQLQSANFSQAQGAATTDLNRNLTAQQSNQSAGLQGAGVDLGAAQQLGNLTAQGQTANQAGLTGALAGQTQLQQQNQAEINAPIQDALQRQGVLQSAVSSVPYGTTQNTTSNGPGATSNPWLTGLGALGTGASIAGTLAPLFSDRTMKTDIKKVGRDKETDLPLYAFRYKDDPKTYPKVVGIMAQDAQKDYPDQVVEVGGKLAVRSNFLSGIMERANGN